jgi:uncharacterized protein (DUF697 family)
MAVKVRKPILVGGLGLSFGLWLWWNFQDSLMHAGEVGLAWAMALGGGLWLLNSARSPQNLTLPLPQTVTQAMLDKAIASAKTLLALVATEASAVDLSALNAQLEGLPQRQQRQTLQVAIAGTKGTGKTAIAQWLESQFKSDRLSVVETEALFGTCDPQDTKTKTAALAADLVILLVNGDLTDSEFQILRQWRSANQHLLLCLNKQDRYRPEERAIILEQVKARVAGLVNVEDISAIAIKPAPMKVRQHQEDGTIHEYLEAQNPEIAVLGDRLAHLLEHQRQQLVRATTWREAMQLQAIAKTHLNAARRERALPIIERYQWIGAAAAFANPVAALDLLAAAAISTQMLIDLGAIYQQKFSLSQAQNAAGTFGQQMVKLGLVELSTQTIGGLLKSNAVTYVAGGAVQAVSAAYLTRIAGLSLIEYLQEQEINSASATGLNWDQLGQTVQKVFQANQRTAFLQGFVKQATTHLATDSQQTEAAI